jgi:hypothetical protein
LLCGAVLVAIVLYDVFETVVVPRKTGRRFRVAPLISLWLWPLWRSIGIRLQPAWRREDFLGTFAPFVIVVLLVTWVLTLVIGFGLILHGLGDQIVPPAIDHATAFYLAGASLFTLGFADVVPVGWAARMAALLAGASGLAVVALVISLVFNLYTSFARREVLVLLLDSRAGVPPSGFILLETFGRYGIIDELVPLFGKYEIWTAEMLDSHLAYPILPYFRSSHDGQSWVSALGAVLDAATLLITVIPTEALGGSESLGKARAAAAMMYSIGCHALIDLTQLRAPRAVFDATRGQAGIERSEFDTACLRLRDAGYETDCGDVSWQAFSDRRSVYAARLNLLARFLASPPTQWIGDRSTLTMHHSYHLGP